MKELLFNIKKVKGKKGIYQYNTENEIAIGGFGIVYQGH